ncbi:hypothetical protein DL96DRAFT_1463537 [Flagelloscypha sp. PMI_526]|nr:hypothetical protein DL96DRAFT_1463537 [Flagelloscypha sp. PMI_526]
MPVPLRSGNPKADAKYNVTTEFPNLGLHAASASGNVGLVEYALSNGQPVNSVLDGVLPLHAACAGGNEQVVKVLLDHGADVNAPRLPTRYSSNRDATALKVGESGSTPLHFASANGHTNIVSLLLLKGARADHADKRGVTPGMLAKQEGWLECEQLLRTWLANKDKDLRERPKRTNSSGHTEEQDLRKRVQVKRSIDTALNMLKASGTNLTESYHKASPSHQTVPLSSSPPASPTSSHPQSSENLTKFGEYTFYPISPIDDRPIDPNARRPSLPHLSSDGQSLLPEPLVDGGSKSRRRIHRRPRSAGNDSNPSDTTSSRRLGPKYSFMNLFKGKDCGASTPSGVAASLSRASATGSSVSLASRENPSASTASLSRHRHRMGSDAARQGSQSLLPPAIDEDEDDDYSYGHLLDSSHRRPMHTKPAPISIISNRGRGDSFTSTGSLSPILSADLGGPKLIKADFPFSLEDSPAVINESALLTANTTRSRGDSLSSMGTNTTTDDSQLLSASGFTNSSGGSATVISPSLAGLPEHPDGPIGHPPLKAGEIGIVVRSETGEPSEVHVADSSPRHISGSFKDRRNHTPEELDLRSGSDTEERVQKAKKDILDLGNDSEAADQLANLPLSARLAAFGEALEKQQRQTTMKSEPPKSASNRPPIPPRSPQRPEPVVRQQSLEAPASNRVRKRTKVPRRPHTSQGDDGNCFPPNYYLKVLIFA